MHLDLAGVAKRFGDVQALAGVTSTIPAGRRLAMVGPNGSGKSTLIRAILGLVSCEGSVRVDGRPARATELARRLAYVPQVAPQAAAPVADLLAAISMVRGLPMAAIAASAERFQIPLAGVLGRPLRALSGGTKQKLLLAVAFAAPAELVVLDEPTASLDARARAAFFARVAELPAETTVILCSHRLEEIHHLVDHVVALEEGRLVHDGPADAVLAARSTSVVSCLVDAGDESWLLERGFARGAGNWWARTVSRAEKLELLPAAILALHGRLRDLHVRELDRLEMTP